MEKRKEKNKWALSVFFPTCVARRKIKRGGMNDEMGPRHQHEDDEEKHEEDEEKHEEKHEDEHEHEDEHQNESQKKKKKKKKSP